MKEDKQLNIYWKKIKKIILNNEKMTHDNYETIGVKFRKIIDYLSKKNFGMKATNYIKNNLKELIHQNIWYQLFNLFTHELTFDDLPHETTSIKFGIKILLDTFDVTNIININWLNNSSLKKTNWKISSNKNLDYNGFIINRKVLPGNLYLYKVHNINKGYKQIKPRWFYSKLYLSEHTNYVLQYSTQYDNENKKSKRNYIDSALIQKKYLKDSLSIFDNDIWINEKEYSISFIDILKYKVKIIFDQRIKENFNKLSSFDKCKLLVALKTSDKKTLEKNERTSHRIKYQYWMINPNLLSASLIEKNAFSDFFKFKTEKEGLKNFLFSLEWYLIRKNDPILENWKNKDWDYNESIKDNYDEKKIYEYKLNDKLYFVNGENKKLLLSFEKILNFNKSKFYKWNQNQPKNNIKNISHISKVMRSFLSVIKGNAGSGKTTLISEIINELVKIKESVIYLAPTHKAKNVMENILKFETNTETIQSFNANENYYQNIIIDEISMIDDEQYKMFFKKIEKYNYPKRLIFVGDDMQIKPIHSKGFSDIIFQYKSIHLKENYRQQDQKLKLFINSFRDSKFNNFSADYIKFYSSAGNLYEKIKEIKKYNFITPINYGEYGVENLNRIINTDIANAKSGDVIIILETPEGINSNVKKHIHKNKKLRISNVFKINENEIVFEFDYKFQVNINQQDWYTKNGKLYYKFIKNEDNNIIDLANVITVHNSQGSTMKNVVFIVPPNLVLSHKLFYTAISRSSDKLIIFLPLDFDFKNNINFDRNKKIKIL